MEPDVREAAWLLRRGVRLVPRTYATGGRAEPPGLAGARRKLPTEPKPRTYRLVESDSGTCPECGRIDHRYLNCESDGAYRVTRTCDEHHLIWAVADLPN